MAQAFLQGQGLQPLLRNFRAPRGELDLVMQQGQTLVVVEVRKRGNPRYGTAVESVDARKRSRIVHAAQYLLARYPQWADRPLRFDVIALDAQDRIEWLQAAFDADG
jgi:putative endonuclease